MPNNTIQKSVKEILNALQYGSSEDKLEAIALARRKEDKFFTTLIYDQKKSKRISKKVSTMEPFSSAEIEMIKLGLSDILEKGKDLLVCWYASIVLIEIKSLSESILEVLWNSSIQLLKNIFKNGKGSMLYAIAINKVREETIRALSLSKSFPGIGEKINKCFEGEVFVDEHDSGDALREISIYAFGAIGDSSYLELIKYWSENGESRIKNAAKAALELWGQESYDNIKKSAEKMEKSNFCFIATAVYETPYALEVQILQNFKNHYLSKSSTGRWLIGSYYKISPFIAKILEQND